MKIQDFKRESLNPNGHAPAYSNRPVVQLVFIGRTNALSGSNTFQQSALSIIPSSAIQKQIRRTHSQRFWSIGRRVFVCFEFLNYNFDIFYRNFRGQVIRRWKKINDQQTIITCSSLRWNFVHKSIASQFIRCFTAPPYVRHVTAFNLTSLSQVF